MVPSTGSPTLKESAFGFHKRNSRLQFSGTPATGFLGRLGGQASGPISCCCNDMPSVDCRLEGTPSVPKSCRNGGFPAKFEHLYTALNWRFLGRGAARHCLL